MSALQHLPSKSPVVVLKQSLTTISSGTIEKLYSIVPSLDDSSFMVHDEITHEAREPNERDFVMRFVLRELRLFKADADVLAKANQSQGVHAFLRESLPSHLEYYIKFFTAFKEGREDNMHHLRDAVYDYLQDPKSASTLILGAAVNTGDNSRSMNTKAWDVLLTDFHDLVHCWKFELFAFKFEDLLLVKTPITCRRYGNKDFDNEEVVNGYQPDQYISQGCTLAVFQGLLVVTKGFCDAPVPSLKTIDGMISERQLRCYLVGRMSRNNVWTRRLAQEFSERVASVLVFVYDRDEAVGNFEIIVPPPSDQDPWLRRYRPASTTEELSSQSWTIDWSIKDIRGDLALLNRFKGRSMTKDYYEFIIINRSPGRIFDTLDLVADALLELKGYLPHEEIVRDSIQRCVPAEELDSYLKLSGWIHSSLAPTPLPPQYLGSRVRCWNTQNLLRRIAQTFKEGPWRNSIRSEYSSFVQC